jgi:hypothetical protein
VDLTKEQIEKYKKLNGEEAPYDRVVIRDSKGKVVADLKPGSPDILEPADVDQTQK